VRRIVVAVIAGLSLLPLGASGQTAPAAPPPPLAQALHGEAKQAYDSAKLLAQNNDFAGALQEFTHAYKISKDPRLLYNMAICEQGLHHYARMKAVLEQYLAERGPAITPESRALAEDALAATKSLVAGLKVTVNESGAEVLVDGQSVGTTPLPSSLPLDIGSHRVTVKKAGFDTAEQTVEAYGGSEVALAISLAALRHTAQFIVSADAASTIVVDGNAVARGHFDGAIEPGLHHVNVSEPGRQTYRADIELHEGETRQLQVTLEEEKHGASPWPWVIGGAAVAAGLAVGGYFLFRPHEQDTTPVPPGQFGSVQFMAWGR
jgi:hypothetical protein